MIPSVLETDGLRKERIKSISGRNSEDLRKNDPYSIYPNYLQAAGVASRRVFNHPYANSSFELIHHTEKTDNISIRLKAK